MKNKIFFKELMILAVPIMIQFTITSCLNLMDSLMIGSLGDEAVAALGIANQYYFMFNLILMGIYSGGGVLISQYYGTHDMPQIKKVLGVCLSIGVCFSAISALIGHHFSTQIISIFDSNPTVVNLGSKYLMAVVVSYVFMSITFAFGISSRSIGKAYVPMGTSAVALVINIVLNYGLIFGHWGLPKLGVLGAAYATVFARFVEMVLMVSYIYISNNPLKSKAIELFGYSKTFFKTTMQTVMPVVINELCWGVGFVIYSYFYGHLGTKALASVQISNTIYSLFMILLFAVSNASCVMVGKKVGEGNDIIAKRYGDLFIKLTLGLGIIMGVLLFLLSPFILDIYKVSPEVLESTKWMLYINAILLPIRFMGVILIVGIFRGGGSSHIALKIELFTMWCIGVPICFLGAMILKLEVYQVFALVSLEEISKCFISLWIYKKNTWIKNLTDEKSLAS